MEFHEAVPVGLARDTSECWVGGSIRDEFNGEHHGAVQICSR